MPEPRDLNKGIQKLIVFDDMIADKNQEKIINYFIYGRKQGCSTFILSQSYYAIPKTIRGHQFSYLILVKISGVRDLNMILKDTGSLNFDDDTLLKKMYNKATSTPMNFLKIDMNLSDINKRFSLNFNQFFKLENEN